MRSPIPCKCTVLPLKGRGVTLLKECLKNDIRNAATNQIFPYLDKIFFSLSLFFFLCPDSRLVSSKNIAYGFSYTTLVRFSHLSLQKPSSSSVNHRLFPYRRSTLPPGVFQQRPFPDGIWYLCISRYPIHTSIRPSVESLFVSLQSAIVTEVPVGCYQTRGGLRGRVVLLWCWYSCPVS